MSKQRGDVTPTDSGILNALADTNNYAACNEGETIVEREKEDDEKDDDGCECIILNLRNRNR